MSGQNHSGRDWRKKTEAGHVGGEIGPWTGQQTPQYARGRIASGDFLCLCVYLCWIELCGFGFLNLWQQIHCKSSLFMYYNEPRGGIFDFPLMHSFLSANLVLSSNSDYYLETSEGYAYCTCMHGFVCALSIALIRVTAMFNNENFTFFQYVIQLKHTIPVHDTIFYLFKNVVHQSYMKFLHPWCCTSDKSMT